MTTQTDERPLPALLTIPRAAELLGISRASAYRYAAAGELPVRRLGGRVYVITARLLAMVDGRSMA
jgi:excisionase family DNA binding protein